jgi:glycogen synthase
MLSARVSILTNVGGHAEVVTDNLTGFIARDPEPAALAEAMERAWAARDRWREMGEAARERMLSFLPDDPVGDFVEKALVLAESPATNIRSTGTEKIQ